MKVRVSYATEIDNFQREAIGCWWHDELHRPANRDELKEYFRQQGTENMDDVLSQYESRCAAEGAIK